MQAWKSLLRKVFQGSSRWEDRRTNQEPLVAGWVERLRMGHGTLSTSNTDPGKENLGVNHIMSWKEDGSWNVLGRRWSSVYFLQDARQHRTMRCRHVVGGTSCWMMKVKKALHWTQRMMLPAKTDHRSTPGSVLIASLGSRGTIEFRSVDLKRPIQRVTDRPRPIVERAG